MFYEGNSASADSSATQSSELSAPAGPPEIVASGSSAGTTVRTFGAQQAAWSAVSGHSSVFMRFTVVGTAVPYAAEGTLFSGSPGAGNGSFILYRTSGGFQQIERADNQAFSVSGTLPPGTYEMGSGASCSSDQPVSCTASFDISFDVDP